MSQSKMKNLSCPLAVAFHCWADQCTPLLDFTCFHSLEWKKQPIQNSRLWSENYVTSLLFGGTKSGTIIAYKILSNQNQILDVVPICLFCGHHPSITSITNCAPLIYDTCIGSLSKDGTVSIISVEDLTIVQNLKHLFSENSSSLAKHDTYTDLLLAAQIYGTVEVASISQSAVLYRISGFSSTIRSITCHGTMHSISCSDCTAYVISAGDNEVGYTYSLSPTTISSSNNENSQNDNSFSVQSCLSPDLSFLIVLSQNYWMLYENGKKPFVSQPPKKNDFYTKCQWISSKSFFVQTFSGNITIWEVPSKTNELVFDVLDCNKRFLFVNKQKGKMRIEPIVVQNAVDFKDFPQCSPKCVFETSFSLKSINTPIIVTCEHFVAFPLGKSVLEMRGKKTTFVCNLSDYFSSKYKARIALGDPIQHEARIGADFAIYLDDFQHPIGYHSGAFMLYSIPIARDKFMSFAKDGSIKIWTPNESVSIHCLCSPVLKTKYFPERRWVCCIAQFSFVVIDCFDLSVVTLCTGHDSPIVDISLDFSVFLVKTEASNIYVWSVDGELVSQRKFVSNKKLGVEEVPDQDPVMPKSFSAPAILQSNKPFSKIITINLPNCQTFSLVVDVGQFVTAFDDFNELDVKTDPQFLPLRLLWSSHCNRNMFGEIPILNNFDYAPAGDNFTVTLPIAFKSTKKRKLEALKKIHSVAMMPQSMPNVKQISISNIHPPATHTKENIIFTSDVAFHMSPLLSSIHACAASAAGQCFISSQKDDLLSILSASSQTTTAQAMVDAVNPSIYALAIWLLSPSPNLRIITTNIISSIFESEMNQTQAIEMLKTIQNKFYLWEIVLPFVFIICRLFTVPESLLKDAAQNIFPLCIQQAELLDTLSACFDVFIPYINLNTFFSNLYDASLNGSIGQKKIVTFALHCPLDFFDAMRTKNCVSLFNELFERWKPDQKILLQIVTRMTSDEFNGQGNYQHVFEIMQKNVPYYDFCKEFIVCGDDEGVLTVIGRNSAKILWQKRVFSNVSFVTVAPTGQRMIAFSMTDKTLIWFVQGKGKQAKEMFEAVKTIQVEFPANPKQSFWVNDTKVTLYSDSGTLYQDTAPNLSFFKRLF